MTNNKGPQLETEQVMILVCRHHSLAHLHGQQVQWTHRQECAEIVLVSALVVVVLWYRSSWYNLVKVELLQNNMFPDRNCKISLLLEKCKNNIQCFAFHRESDRQGVKETAQQTAKSPEEGPVRGGEEECRERETAEESEEEERGR